jgi:hypothetical protein
MSEEAPLRAPARWRIALVYAGLSAVFTALYFAYPGFHLFPLPTGHIVPTAPILAAVPLASLAWAGAGMIREKTWAARAACATSMLTAAGCLAIIAFSAWNDFVV